MASDILLMECDDPLRPEWKRVAIFQATEGGYELKPLAQSPVFLTLKEWFADGITAIVENEETGELELKKTPPRDEEFIRRVEDGLGARYRLVR
jgi:hypothetical protein